MKELAQPYRRVNTQPSEFMRPPTETFKHDLKGLSAELDGKIHKAGITLYEEMADRDRKKTFANDQIGLHTNSDRQEFKPRLLVGSELELVIFSKDSVPHEDQAKLDDENPNFTSEHLKNVKEIVETIALPPDQGGLGDILEKNVTAGRIFMETRTRPTTVAEYANQMERIQKWMQDRAEELDVHPAVYSQHLHLSLTDTDEGINLLQSDRIRNAVRAGLTDIYHRALPLVRIPEHLDDDSEFKIGTTYGVLDKGIPNSLDNPLRVEGRVNNSEYASDPDLNLAVAMLGIFRGLTHVGKVRQLYETYPLEELSKRTSKEPKSPHFIIGNGEINYEEALEHLLIDDVLKEVLPAKLQQIPPILYSYRDISTGKVDVADVRDEAYKAA